MLHHGKSVYTSLSNKDNSHCLILPSPVLGKYCNCENSLAK